MKQARRVNLSIPDSLFEACQPRIDALHCSGFSDYVATLIRDDVRQHATGLKIADTAPPIGNSKIAS